MTMKEKSWTGQRCLQSTLWSLVVLVGVPTAIVAQEDHPDQLTVEGAVRISTGRPAVGAALEARVQASRAEEKSAGLWPNPQVGYDHAHLFDGEIEDTVAITQALDIAGKRRAAADAAEQRTRRITAENEIAGLARERRARLGFFRVLHAQRVSEALDAWVAGLEEAARVASQRADAGDASEYDRLRISRELARARGRSKHVAAQRERAWADLAGLLGVGAGEDRPRLVGELLPGDPLPTTEEIRERVANSPDRKALEAEIEVWRLERRAAARSWFPDIDVTVGYRTAEAAGDRAHGFIAGVALPVPLFDRGQGGRGVAEAGQRLAEADLELARDLLLGEALGLRRETELLVEAASELRAQAREGAPRLIESADAAYRGGEIGVLELVDAHENDLEAEIELLDMELAARVATINLDRQLGRRSR